MPRFNQGKKRQEETIFFTDNLNSQEKEVVNKAFSAKDMDIQKSIEKLVDNGLSLKIAWSEYNDSYSATVSPIDREHPSSGTFYSAFHANWQKAVFLVNYLLDSRYSYGDWTANKAKRFDNNW